MSLLTLDQTTLFYYLLSDTTYKKKFEDFSSGINSWAATIPKYSKPVKNKVTASVSGQSNNVLKHSGSISPLTDATTHSSDTSAKILRSHMMSPSRLRLTTLLFTSAKVGLKMMKMILLNARPLLRAPLKARNMFQA